MAEHPNLEDQNPDLEQSQMGSVIAEGREILNFLAKPNECIYIWPIVENTFMEDLVLMEHWKDVAEFREIRELMV